MTSKTANCPFLDEPQKSFTNQDWWPNELNLHALHENSVSSCPYGEGFDYAVHFLSLDLNAVMQDLHFLLTDSKDWWPADFGNYGPFFIRMSWHSAGTYRIADGRGGAGSGAQRFAPLNCWPDNVNLDKARRLLWPIKQKYGRKLSWADLIVLAGTVSLQSMGLKIFGFAGGREDTWSAQETDWGPETTWLGDERYKGDRELADPLAAVQMGLIYVNPEGPNGRPDPLASAVDIRETFARMAMNDEETVALIAGGHTFGKAHGAANPQNYVGPVPASAPVEEQGLGWINTYGTGNADDTISSGLEGTWTSHPTTWSGEYFDNLFGFEWELTQSPAGAHQWTPKGTSIPKTVPDAHDANVKHHPNMLTTDLALKLDPIYAKISKHFHENPLELAQVFAKAWYKLTHRDMGPISRYLGPLVPKEQLIWQDPLPCIDTKWTRLDESSIQKLKEKITNSGLSVSQLIKTAWASAVTFRSGDKRGGANGARIRLLPQKNWMVNEPDELSKVLKVFEKLQLEFIKDTSSKSISVADLIVLGGCLAIESAAKNAGHIVKVPFVQGRVDALQEQTDIDSFAPLEPKSDGFRNFIGECPVDVSAKLLVDRASQLKLTSAQMTVLVGGMRVLNTNFNGSTLGVFTNRAGSLTNDFFINLLDMDTIWRKSTIPGVFEGNDRGTGEIKWRGSQVDLTLGSNPELRAIAEIYASDDGETKFIQDFIAAWNMVMNLDRFEIKSIH